MENNPLPNWHYWHGEPTVSALFKSIPEDFQVTEIPLTEPSGDGEHHLIWLEKVNLNTAFVAEQLAKYLQVPLRNVSYAGRKDKYALTRQYFSVQMPKRTAPDFSQWQLAGAQILSCTRHNRKLRIGALRGNRFDICLRELSQSDELDNRLARIRDQGVPNYFGQQRFGNGGSNLLLGLRMADGEPIRNRNRRSMAISALRAKLFNDYISARLQQGRFEQAISGDVMQLAGSQSFFVAETIDSEIIRRLNERDIFITGPLWGEDNSPALNSAAELEHKVFVQQQSVCQALNGLSLQQERRAIKLLPQNMQWHWQDDTLQLSFSLPSGCFATAVLRELVNVNEGAADENSAE